MGRLGDLSKRWKNEGQIRTCSEAHTTVVKDSAGASSAVWILRACLSSCSSLSPPLLHPGLLTLAVANRVPVLMSLLASFMKGYL